MADAVAGGRASRVNRGNRMGKLIAEAEGDDEFWNQDAWKEEAADEEYHSEKEEADVFDSDFGDEESDEEEEEDGDERPRKKPTLKPPGQVKRVAKPAGGKAAPKAVRPLTDLEDAAAAAATDGQAAPHRSAQPKPARQAPVVSDADLVRKSKRALVLEADEHRERARAAEAARPKPAKVKKATDDVRPPTQEEMLAEAAQTELLNTADLQRILAMEEETKRRAVVVKQPYEGPLVRFRSSRQRGDELLFLGGADPQLGMPHGFAPGLMPGPKAVCAVTGRDARYQDPVTELPYADARALAVIRSAAEGDRLHTLPFFAAAKQSARLLGQFRRQRMGATDANAAIAVA